MFHSNTEQLIDYWRTRRGSEETPTRASINPVDFAKLLPQVFMLGRQGPGLYRVRLAGGFIADLHGRELRHADFLRLWEPAARTPLQLAFEAVRRRPEPLVIEAEAHAGEGIMRVEILVAPLRAPNGQVDRVDRPLPADQPGLRAEGRHRARPAHPRRRVRLRGRR